MARLVSAVATEVEGYIKGLWTYEDPRSADLPLIRNPIPVFLIIGGYLYFVLSLGPRLMKDRPPFELRRVMIVYNALQVVWCGYLLEESWRLGWGFGGRYNLICEPLSMEQEPLDYEIAYTVWLYFILKIFDLMDTVFMILRKNLHQISFLHVYHHAGMVFCIYLGTKIYPGGHHTFLGFINCLVHCLLYGYYLLSLLFPGQVKSAWWKKYITLIQLAQFGLNVVHESIPLFMTSCGVDRRISAALVTQNVFMFALFGDFYYKAYIRKNPKSHNKET